MQDRTLLRIGAVSLIAGVVLNMIFAALLLPSYAPQPLDPSDIEATLQSIVDSPMWAGIHVVILAAFLLYVGGLLALHRSITGEPGAALARLGFAAALMGGAILSVSEAIFGSGAMKTLADAWAVAADKAVPFAVAEAMLLVGYAAGGIFDWGWVVLFGVAPILYGLAIARTDLYPKWLGWVGVVVGVGNALIETVQFSQGWSPVTNTVFSAFTFPLFLWLLVIGVLMWRRASAAANL